MSYAICAEHYNWNESLAYSDWQWYAVLSFRYLISKELARQRLDHWIEELWQWTRMEATYIAVFNCAPSSLQWHVLLCGNGGSAADAQHLAAELLVRLRPHVNRCGIPAVALAADMSSLTAWQRMLA